MLVLAAMASFSQVMDAADGPITPQAQCCIAPESCEDLGNKQYCSKQGSGHCNKLLNAIRYSILGRRMALVSAIKPQSVKFQHASVFHPFFRSCYS